MYSTARSPPCTRPRCGVGEERRIDELGEFFAIVGGCVLGNVTNDRGAYAEIEQTVVSGDRKNQDPDSKSRVAKMMQDEGGEIENSERSTLMPSANQLDPTFFRICLFSSLSMNSWLFGPGQTRK